MQKKNPYQSGITEELMERIESLTEDEQHQLMKIMDRLLMRRHRELRKFCSIPVNYTINGRPFSSVILDISASGAFIKTEEKFSAGQKIILLFAFDKNNKFKIAGEIVRVKPHGIAVQFSNATQYQMEQIKVLIRQMEEAKEIKF